MVTTTLSTLSTSQSYFTQPCDFDHILETFSSLFRGLESFKLRILLFRIFNGNFTLTLFGLETVHVLTFCCVEPCSFNFRLQRPENLKTSLTIENWPWGGPNGTSFVVASFVGVVQAHDSFGNLSAELVTQESQLSVNTSRYRLAMQSTLFLLLDEMPVLKSFSPGMYRTRGPIGVPTPIAYFSTLSVCRHNEPGILPHWRKLWYDPQFSSIFLGSSALDPTLDAQTTPTEKNNRKVVAIAAGVSVGAVAILGVAAAIVYFKWYHRTPAKPAVTL